MADIDSWFSKRHLDSSGKLESLMNLSRSERLFIEEEIDMVPLVVWNKCSYIKRFFEMESSIARNIKRIRDQDIDAIQVSMDGLTPSQQGALHLICNNSICAITGGPGSGKSYFLKNLAAKRQNVTTTALTGKATMKIRVDKANNGTLHKVFSIGKPYQITDSQIVIIDEASMIGASLWQEILEKIPNGVRVILSGDPNQLAPIKEIGLFKDITKVIPRAHLNEKLRGNKALIKASEKVSSGDLKGLMELVPIYPLEKFSKKENFSILTPFRHGPYGLNELNQEASGRVPITITSNDYYLNLMNGDMGYLDGQYALFNERRIHKSILRDYEISLATSIHKSQGSEFDNLQIILPPKGEECSRELLYTAITRARVNLEIYSNIETLSAILLKKLAFSSNLHKQITLDLKL